MSFGNAIQRTSRVLNRDDIPAYLDLVQEAIAFLEIYEREEETRIAGIHAEISAVQREIENVKIVSAMPPDWRKLRFQTLLNKIGMLKKQKAQRMPNLMLVARFKEYITTIKNSNDLASVLGSMVVMLKSVAPIGTPYALDTLMQNIQSLAEGVTQQTSEMETHQKVVSDLLDSRRTDVSDLDAEGKLEMQQLALDDDVDESHTDMQVEQLMKESEMEREKLGEVFPAAEPTISVSKNSLDKN